MSHDCSWQAADTDSIVGSVCLAYLRQRQSAPAVRWVAPWIQCSRRELSLRSETSALLRRAGVDPAWLVCRDELDLTHLRAGDVRFVLVDHNALAGRILDAAPWAADAVEEIIDHHLDTGAHPVRCQLLRCIELASLTQRVRAGRRRQSP